MQYLIFDRSEPADGVVSYDSSCTVTMGRWAQLNAEVGQVLTWLRQASGEAPGPLDEGHAWDLDLQGSSEVSCAAAVEFDPGRGGLVFAPQGKSLERRTIHLIVTLRAGLAVDFEASGFLAYAED